VKCLNCGKRPAVKDSRLSWLPCTVCQTTKGITDPIEIVTDDIKNQRKMHIKDIIQPFRDGHLSKEYVKLWGTKRIKVPQEEIDSAVNTWDDIPYYKDSL